VGAPRRHGAAANETRGSKSRARDEKPENRQFTDRQFCENNTLLISFAVARIYVRNESVFIMC
jgi:hypothetical protein